MKRLLLLAALAVLAPSASARDAMVYVFNTDGSFHDGAAVSSGALRVTTREGRALLSGLPDGFVWIEVSAPGRSTVRLASLPGDPPAAVTLAPRPEDGQQIPMAMRESSIEIVPARRIEPRREASGERAISGRVTVGGRGIAGIPVTIHPIDDSTRAPLEAATDAEGRFRVSPVPAGRYVVSPAAGLEWRIRTPWSDRMWEEGRQPGLIDVTEQNAGTFEVDLLPVPFIRGRVLDAGGKPVTGIEVAVVPENANYVDAGLLATRTLPTGEFAVLVPHFEPGQRVELAAGGAAWSIVRSASFDLRKPPSEVVIRLPRFESVRLRVVDPEGVPIHGATATFSATGEIDLSGDPNVLLAQHRASRFLLTDGEGTVRLNLVAGEYDFAVRAPRFQSRILSAVSIARPGTVDVVLEPAVSIAGRVHRAGRGVPGVQIHLDRDPRRRGGMVMTDGDGRFEIDGLARGESYRVGIFKYDEMIERLIETRAPAELDVELEPNAKLVLHVVDGATRAPVQQFTYALEPRVAEDRRSRGRMQRAETVAGGTAVEVPPGAYHLSASSEGFVPSKAVEIEVTAEEALEITIPLDRGASITGIVTDEGGAPIAEAALWATPEITRERAERERSFVGREFIPVTGRTDQTGSFTLTGIPPGRVVFMVRKEGYVPRRESIEIEGAVSREVRLDRGLTLTGVVTRDGRPEAEVQIGAATAAIEGEHQSTMTDEQGRFTLTGMIAARYTLSAFKEGVGHTEVPNVDISRERDIAIRLDAQPRATIHGSFTGLPPLRQKLVGFVVAQGKDRGSEGQVDPSGNFRIENVPPGTVTVLGHLQSSAGTRSSAPVQIEIRDAETLHVDLDFAPALTVRGRVTHQLKPLAGARVNFMGAHNANASAIVRQDGTYEAVLTVPGTWRVFVHSEGLDARSFQTVREFTGDTTFDIDVRESVLEGIIVDRSTRHPVARALVTLLNDGTPDHGPVSEAQTDAGGRFVLPVSAIGPHRMVVSAPGYAHRTQSIVLDGNLLPPLTLDLAPAGALQVRVVDAATGVSLDAHLTVADETGAGLPLHPTRSEDGRLYTLSLAPGRYRLTAVVQGYPAKTIVVQAPGVVEVAME